MLIHHPCVRCLVYTSNKTTCDKCSRLKQEQPQRAREDEEWSKAYMDHQERLAYEEP